MTFNCYYYSYNEKDKKSNELFVLKFKIFYERENKQRKLRRKA